MTSFLTGSGIRWWLKKDLTRDSSIKLSDMALLAVVNLVKDKNFSDTQAASAKKYFANAVPLELRRKLLEKASRNGEKQRTILNLYSVLESENGIVDDKVDLLGNSINCIDMELDSQNIPLRRRWVSFYTLPPLNEQQLRCLDKILKNAESKRSLVGISFCADRDDLSYRCDIPARLTKGQSLVKVVILEGASNHILRILGISCPVLRFLDVSNSVSVTNTGLRNLLLQRPPLVFPQGPAITGERIYPTRRDMPTPTPVEQLPKNSCVTTLEIIILSGTSVSEDGCNFTCSCIPNTYIHLMRPEIKICKMKMQRANVDRELQTVTLAAVVAIRERDPLHEYEYFQAPRHPEDKPITIVYCRHPPNFVIYMAMKLEGNMITGLHCPCYNLDEYLNGPKVNLETLASNFQNLKVFEGAVRGIIMPRPNNANLRFPRLEKANVWAQGSTQAVYFLRHSPVLKRFKYSTVDIWTARLSADEIDPEAGHVLQLTHAVLTDTISRNPGLLQNLEEFIVLPMLSLNKDSLTWITERCINLKAIGDLQGWTLTKNEIQEVATNLRKQGKTGITLVIHNQPTSDRDCEERESWIPF